MTEPSKYEEAAEKYADVMVGRKAMMIPETNQWRDACVADFLAGAEHASKEDAQTIKELREALSLQDQYTKLLGEEIDSMVPLAHTHGWRSTRHEAGKELREKIENARKLLEP